jgi:hypothetical protein
LRHIGGGALGFSFLREVTMQGIKSAEGKWSISLCSCSRETAHFHYGNAILHISLDDLRDLGIAMQRVAEDVACSELHDRFDLKKGLVQ